MIEKAYYRPDEIAEKLSVTIRTVYNWIEKGRLIAVQLPSGIYRIQEDDFKQFLLHKTSKINTDFTVSNP